MENENTETRATSRRSGRLRHIVNSWPVLIPVGLIGGLLWLGLWYSRRAQLFEESGHVEFDAPSWQWLESITGPEIRSIIGSPTALHLPGEHPSWSELRLVAGFDELRDFSAAGFSDADLEYLEGCTQLESLSLRSSSLTVSGLRSLKRFPQLKYLWFATDQPLSREAFAFFGNLTSLEVLSIESPQIAESSLVPLAGLTKLNNLWLNGATIRGDELKHLAALPNLRMISLRHSVISESALAALQPLPSGTSLNLTGSTITDAHLPAIRKLNWLSHLDLAETQVSNEACWELKRERPGMHLLNAEGMTVLTTPVSPTVTPSASNE